MNKWLVLKLQGLLQAWGGHTYEDLRHSELIPTRSGLLGLLGACLGIDRSDKRRLEDLSTSVKFTVRTDSKAHRMTDFHTVMAARKVDGKPNKYPIVSRREYLCDASYTVVIGATDNAVISLQSIVDAVKKPIYTPCLGRRSCAVSRPLFEDVVDAESVMAAFSLFEPVGGVIYSETRLNSDDSTMRFRDQPIHTRKRQFASRDVFVHNEHGGSCVSE